MAFTSRREQPDPQDSGVSKGPVAAVGSATAVAPPPKMRRRPLLIAMSIAAVCLGALLAELAFTSVKSTHAVLAVRTTVHRGDTITRADLMTVQVGVDPALKPMAASQLSDVIGQRAAMDLAAGGLITGEAVTSSVVPGKGMSLVGIDLEPGALPASDLHNGDRVRIVLTPGQQGEYTNGSTAATEVSGLVVKVATAGASGEQRVVDVLVTKANAPDVASMAATGKVALILDSREN